MVRRSRQPELRVSNHIAPIVQKQSSVSFPSSAVSLGNRPGHTHSFPACYLPATPQSPSTSLCVFTRPRRHLLASQSHSPLVPRLKCPALHALKDCSSQKYALGTWEQQARAVEMESTLSPTCSCRGQEGRKGGAHRVS